MRKNTSPRIVYDVYIRPRMYLDPRVVASRKKNSEKLLLRGESSVYCFVVVCVYSCECGAGREIRGLWIDRRMYSVLLRAIKRDYFDKIATRAFWSCKHCTFGM